MTEYTQPARPANRNDWQAFYTLEIEKLLELCGQMTLSEMADALGLDKGSLAHYLRLMRRAGIVGRDGYRDGKPMWKLGQEDAPPKNIKPVEDMHKHQRTVTARQLGMVRHWMDVALFGPAGVREAAA